MKKVIIDTDPGIDDALALLLAIKSKMLNIMAITTVCGNSTVENTTKNAQLIIDKVNSPVSIFRGASKPLQGQLIKAGVHGLNGLGDNINLKQIPTKRRATLAILKIIKEFPGEITIITLGPLTNIANCMLKDPETMGLASEIVIMGGALNVPGNKTCFAEFNMFVDPKAAKIVLNFPIKKTLVPLDTCNLVQLSLREFYKITNKDVKKFVIKLIKPYIRNLRMIDGIKKAVMYDPVTVYSVIFPKKTKRELLSINVSTKRPGMLIKSKNRNSNNIVSVVKEIDVPTFKKDFIKLLSKL